MIGDTITWQQLTALFGGFIVAMGIPTAITGVVV